MTAGHTQRKALLVAILNVISPLLPRLYRAESSRRQLSVVAREALGRAQMRNRQYSGWRAGGDPNSSPPAGGGWGSDGDVGVDSDVERERAGLRLTVSAPTLISPRVMHSR